MVKSAWVEVHILLVSLMFVISLSYYCHNPTQPNATPARHPPPPKKKKNLNFFFNQTRPNSVCNIISTSTRRFMHRIIIGFVQPQPNSIENKNNSIGCGTALGNLVQEYYIILVFFSRQHPPIRYVPQNKNKNNPIGCGTAPGNLVIYQKQSSVAFFCF